MCSRSSQQHTFTLLNHSILWNSFCHSHQQCSSVDLSFLQQNFYKQAQQHFLFSTLLCQYQILETVNNKTIFFFILKCTMNNNKYFKWMGFHVIQTIFIGANQMKNIIIQFHCSTNVKMCWYIWFWSIRGKPFLIW